MKINDVQKLIDNPLQPNLAEWLMDVEDILSEIGFLSDDVKQDIRKVKVHNGAFSQYTDSLVAILKRALRKIQNNDMKEDDIIMTKENVFIVYSHQHRNMMLDVKDFIQSELGFEPKTLDIAEFTGDIWGAFSEKSASCQKAVVLMADDDKIVSDDIVYYQARPNVFLELGYMIHKCGLKNVTIVRSENCKMPSDIGGLISVIYKSDRWTESLRKQMYR